MVEWRRSRVIYGRIDFFIVYYKSKLDHTYFKRKIEVGSKNSSDLYLVSPESALQPTFCSDIFLDTAN